MKKILLIISVLLLSACVWAQSKLVITNDTILDIDSIVSNTFFDTIIVTNGADLNVTYIIADSWTRQIGGWKYFLVDSGCRLRGIADSGHVGFKGTLFLNNSGTDSVSNIWFNQHGSPLTIAGKYPTVVNGVRSSWRDRHVYIDTTFTITRLLFTGYRNSLFLTGDTLILTDSAIITPIVPSLYGGSKNDTSFPQIVFDSISGGVFKRFITNRNKGVTDRLPFGFNKNNNVSAYVFLTLDTSVTIAPGAYITYELFPSPHSQRYDTINYLGLTLRINGYGISNLNYDVRIRYPLGSVAGDAQRMVSAFSPGAGWQTQGFNAADRWIILNDITQWGEITAFGGPYFASVSPANGSTSIDVDSVVSITFDQDVDSVNFSSIVIADSTLNFLWNDFTNTITITHPSFAYNTLYTVTIPAGVVETPDGIGNPEIKWSYQTKLFVSTDEIVVDSYRVFPNPATNIINIESGSIITAVNIFDCRGALIKALTCNNHTVSINIDGLPGGLYFVQGITGASTMINKIVLK
mgnify:CR=1 FL=1